MYIATVPNRRSPPAILLRQSYREDGKVKTRTLGNLTSLPKETIELVRRSLKGDRFVDVDDAFDNVASWHHGHVDAVLRAMKRLRFTQLLGASGASPCRERDLVLAMVVGRILEPDTSLNSKLANTRWWQVTTLPQQLGLGDVTEDELYQTMDWLLSRQKAIEKRLAKRHLKRDGLVLYDLTSSYFEGVTCPLAAFGFNRDGKRGKLQVNYGLLTDPHGRPVAVSVFSGNTADTNTLVPQVEKMRETFGIKTMVLVGDRGMICQKTIDDALRDLDEVHWITALKSATIKKLVKEDAIQLDLFDKQNLVELTHPDFPGERLVACYNEALAQRRAKKRDALINATTDALKAARQVIEGGKWRGKETIERRLVAIAKRFQVTQQLHFVVRDDGFDVDIPDPHELGQAALDGARAALARVHRLVHRRKLQEPQAIRRRVDDVLKTFNIAQVATVAIDEGVTVSITDQAAARDAVVCAIEAALQNVRRLVDQGRYGGKERIGLRLGKVIDKRKVAKHFVLNIRNDGFDFHVNQERVAQEAAMDGIYIIRTSLPHERLSPQDTVRSYKGLCQIERAFRSLKTVDLNVRPIRHRLEDRVRAHIFLCMLAYYVEWHMRRVWAPLIFDDEELDQLRQTRDPVMPAKRSERAASKAHTKTLEDGTVVHSFYSLLQHLSQIVRNLCRPKHASSDTPPIEILTTPDATQNRAYQLLNNIAL